MAVVRNGVSISAVLLLVAVILFVLAGLDQHFSSVSAQDLEAFGLASFAASFLLP